MCRAAATVTARARSSGAVGKGVGVISALRSHAKVAVNAVVEGVVG